MIRMANLTCRQCGMSLDEDVNNLDCYCPNCGAKLFISVSQAIDIWNDKKEIKRKDVKYSTEIYAVRDQKTEQKKRSGFWDLLGYAAVIIVLIIYAIIIGYFIAGSNV